MIFKKFIMGKTKSQSSLYPQNQIITSIERDCIVISINCKKFLLKRNKDEDKMQSYLSIQNLEFLKPLEKLPFGYQ
jgi:hypothetical protein